MEGLIRLRILEEELITHFTDQRKSYCAFEELEIEFSVITVISVITGVIMAKYFFQNAIPWF